jgi:hypothetical protein
MCDATHRCSPKPFINSSNCPANFVCSGQQCTRKPCGSDTDCTGRCVNDFCYEDFGTCDAIPA